MTIQTATFNGKPFQRLTPEELVSTVQSLDADATLSALYSVQRNWKEEAKRHGFSTEPDFLLAQLLQCELQLWRPAGGRAGRCLALAGESAVKQGGNGPYALKDTCVDALRRIMQVRRDFAVRGRLADF